MTSSEIWQAILASPSDKSLKTQYIQAMEQREDWRADMFYMEAEIGRLRKIWYIYEADALKAQFDPLFAKWRASFDSPAKGWNAKVILVECWPVELTIPAKDFIRHAPEIVTVMPMRHLNLTNLSEAPDVFQTRELSQIASLDGSRQAWSDEAFLRLTTSQQLKALLWLDLSGTGMTEERVEVLAESEPLKRVQHMDLRGNPCRDPVDAAAGYGTDWETGGIVRESIYLPEYGRELESRHGHIPWLHVVDNFCQFFPMSRYLF